jgi:hypothetical protein
MRLSRTKWKNIIKLFQSGNYTIIQLSKKYGITSHSIYTKFWNDGILQKKKDKSFWKRVFGK